ncbi:ras GEF [Lichtheimia hyalospora FSU 10163]|nr:ras GEF [Lichtheimia hyalospora FSU 10163]
MSSTIPSQQDQYPVSPWTRTMDRLYSPSPTPADNINANDAHLFGMSNEGDEKHQQQQQYGAGSMTTEMPLGQESAIPAPRRKRNNSLIPPELMNDNSEGGRERAALATVFGVREYTESKIFWERQVAAYHEGPNSTSTGTHSATGSDENNNSLAPEDGFVSITSRSIVSSPIGGASTNTREKRKSGASITHLVDSVFDNSNASTTAPMTTTPVANDNPLEHSTITTAASSSSPPNFSLPDIPVVSEFNDLMVVSSSSSTRVFRPPLSIERPSTAPPLSILTTFQPRASSVASSSMSGLTLDHEEISIAGSEQQHHLSDMTPPLVFTEPPAIFDLLLSDDDERIVVWGPDPQAVSASMATTTIAGKTIPSSPPPPAASSTASFASTQTAPPNIKGFSSNTTTVSNPTPPADTSKQRRRGRWSGQLLPEGFKLVSKSSLPLRRNRPHSQLASTTNDDVRESILFKFAKRHGRKDKQRDLHGNNNNNGHTQLAKLPKVIEAATIEKLVEKLTNTLDYTFMTDFFLTYRAFISPTQLCKLLTLRFRWALENDDECRRIVRIRTFVVLRHWLLNYFVHDFIPCRELRVYLTSFLNELPYHRLIRNSPRDQRIVKSLKRVVRRLKKVYYISSSASERVKVIPPPPPTEDQERIEEMVRAKLAQSSIRRKTALVSSMNVSDRHHGNMAVQDTRLAPVVVVGSVRTTRGGSSSRSGISGATSPMDMSRASPTTGVRRNMSSTSIPRFRRRDQRQEIEAVKSSYMKRMEQQRRAMSVDLNTTSSSLKEAPPTPIPQDEEQQQQTRALESSRSSVLTDDSLESALSPGTTDVEMSSDDEETSEEEEDDDDDDDDDDDKQLVAKLETERDRREKEEEMNRAEFFASTRATSEPSSPTPDSPTLRERKLLHRSQHIVNTLPPMPNQEDTVDQQAHLQEVESTAESDAASKSRRSISVVAESKSLPDRVARPSLASSNDDAKVSSISQPDMPPPPQPTSATSPTRIVELDLPKSHIPSSLSPSEPPSRRTSAVYPKPFILYYRSERMAKQLCLIEAQALIGIDWEEMVHCRWTKMPATSTGMGDEYSEYTDDLDDPDINYTRRIRQMQLARREHEGGIEQVIKRFNDVCQWVASEIVHTRALDERVKVVEKFIRLAQKCKLYCNFATLVQILLGLQSPAVSRLRKTWDKVGSNEMRILDQLSAFTSPMKNWKHIRDSMTEVAEEYGMSPVEVQVEMPGTNHHGFGKSKIKIPFGGCIPFLGIYLSDLVFNSEQPPYLQPSHDHHRIYYANNRTMSITPLLLKQPLVNFRKHRITATVIKRVLTFQNLARRYSFERDDELYFLCAEVRASDPDTIRKLSHTIEP